MLIEKNTAPSVGDVVTIKLASGEEVVGRMHALSGETVTLAKPIAVLIQPVENGQVGLSFFPVMGSIEPEAALTFALGSLSIRPVKTGANVTTNYVQMTSSLVLPGHR
jgi:hypothetical protein